MNNHFRDSTANKKLPGNKKRKNPPSDSDDNNNNSSSSNSNNNNALTRLHDYQDARTSVTSGEELSEYDLDGINSHSSKKRYIINYCNYINFFTNQNSFFSHLTVLS